MDVMANKTVESSLEDGVHVVLKLSDMLNSWSCIR